MDLTRRPSGRWIIDFGWQMDEREAALYEAPFSYCLTKVKPEREKNRREAYRRFWWRHVEPRPGYPDRVVSVGPKAAAILKARTLTNLYNERPTWLDNAHRDLDAAVAAAYGWPADIVEEDALARLLALNLERAAVGR